MYKKILLALPFVMLLTLLVSLPFSFNYIDSFVNLFLELKWQVPHYSPLYIALIQKYRTIFEVPEIYVTATWIIHSVILAIALLYYQIHVNFNRWWITIAFVLLNLPFLYTIKGYYQEGFFMIFLLILLASFILITRNGLKPTYLLIHLFGLFVISFTRHLGVIFATLIPIYYLIEFILGIRERKESLVRLSKGIVLAILVVVVTHFGGKLTTQKIGSSTISTIGHPASYRMYETVEMARTHNAKERLLKDWKKGIDDSLLLETIDQFSNVTLNELWYGFYTSRLEELGKRETCELEQECEDLVNKHLNSAFFHLIMIGSRYYISSVWRTFVDYLERPDEVSFIHNNAFMTYNSRDDLVRNYVPNDEHYFWASFLNRNIKNIFWHHKYDKWRYNLVLLLLIFSVVYCLILRRNKLFMQITSIVLVCLIYMFISSLITLHLDRYSIPLSMTFVFAALLVFCDLPMNNERIKL